MIRIKNIIAVPLIMICVFNSCIGKKTNKTTSVESHDNMEMLKMYNEDQADRSKDHIDWSTVSKNDSDRRARVRQLLNTNKIKTSLDHYRAAMIFQHGNDTVSSTMAVKMMRKAVELDSMTDKWLLAAAIDRDLMRKNKPQIFGTQFIRKNAQSPWERYRIDTTKITDEERIIHGVRTLKQQREKEFLMNKKKNGLKVYAIQINVLHMDKAVRFYSKKIGFKVKSKTDQYAELDNKGIKLILYKVSKLRKDQFPKETRTSLSFHTNDLDSLMADYKAKDISLVAGKVENGVGYAATYQDPFGNKINFMEQSKFPVPRFKEPMIYNVGLSVNNLEKAKAFYCDILGFTVRSTKFLPALPLGYADGNFAFMLHKKSVIPATYNIEDTQLMMVFSVPNIKSLSEKLKDKVGSQLKITTNPETGIPILYLTDPFGNVFKIIERK